MPGSPALYWKTQPTGSIGISFSDLLSAAKQVMQDAGLTDIKRSASDVSGRTPNSPAAITFLKNGDTFTSIIMVAGDDSDKVLNKLSKALSKLHWL